MVTIATVCQSKVSSVLLLDGLCNGAKTISVQRKEKKIHSRVEDHLKCTLPIAYYLLLFFILYNYAKIIVFI